MATIVANLTPLHTAETITGAVGNKPVLDNEIFKQGSNSVGFTVTQNKVSGLSFTSVDLTGEHVRLWYTSTTFPNMQSKANGGLRFYIKGGGNTAYWNIAGNDTYFGGWLNIVVDVDSTPDAGSFDKTAVTEIGVEITVSTTPRNAVNTWIDYARYGDGLTAYGATEFGLEEIFQDDLANGYGIVEKIESVFFLSGAITLGDAAGSNVCNYKDSGETIVFTDKAVSAELYAFNGAGNATGDTDIVIESCAIKTAGPNFDFHMEAAAIESFELKGSAITGAHEVLLSGNSVVEGNTFNACGEISPGLAYFHDNTITNSYATNALIWAGITGDIEDCVFTGNINAIVIADAVDQTFVGLTFSGNTADVNNTSGSAIEVAKTSGSNPVTSTGSGVTFTSAVGFELTNLVAGTEVRVFTGTAGASAVAIGGIESSGTTFSMSHSSDGVAGFYVLIKPGYVYQKVTLTFSALDASYPVQQRIDNNYKA